MLCADLSFSPLLHNARIWASVFYRNRNLKTSKAYTQKPSAHILIPVAMETLGSINDKGLKFISVVRVSYIGKSAGSHASAEESVRTAVRTRRRLILRFKNLGLSRSFARGP